MNAVVNVAATAVDDDAAQMNAFAGGDVQAFEWIYQRHHAALYRFVRRLLGREGANLADEAFQDTWLRVVQGKERYQPRGASFRAWLFMLAYQRAVDLLRRSGRERASPQDESGDPPAPEAAAWEHWPQPDRAIDDLAFWRRAGARLMECLDQLPAAQRTVFLLHHEDDIALDELARAFDVGFVTAERRLRHALASLRSCMGAYDDAAASGTKP